MRHARILTALIVLSFVLVISFSAQRARAAGEVFVWINPPAPTVSPGQTFNMSVQVDNLPSPGGAFGFQVAVRWDPSVLTALNMTEELFHSIMPSTEWDNIWPLYTTINNTVGYIYYAYLFNDNPRAVSGGYAPITGNHTLVTITLKGIKTGQTLVYLSENQVVIGDADANPIPWVGANATVTVGNPAPTPTIISPVNGGLYNSSSVDLTFSLSKPAVWTGYSMDEHPNVTVTGNAEIQVADGNHSLVMYANDTLGQMGNSTRVFFAVDTQPPTASFTYSPSTLDAELFHGNFRWNVTFNGMSSHDATTGISSYYWDFGDGSNSTGAESNHIYWQPGTYIVKLTVADFLGNTNTTTQTITINPASKPLSVPYGLILAIVIPAVWVSALLYYFDRTRKIKAIRKKI